MKSLKLFFVLVITVALVMSIAHAMNDTGHDEEENVGISDSNSDISTMHPSRFLAMKKDPKDKLTCNKFPGICRVKGSPGPDCCKKKCVDVLTDRLSCGMCGKKCKYSQICCQGNCVNPLMNKYHCSGCNKNCKRGAVCAYGMCNYA